MNGNIFPKLLRSKNSVRIFYLNIGILTLGKDSEGDLAFYICDDCIKGCLMKFNDLLYSRGEDDSV
jgi:hypothetical protein